MSPLSPMNPASPLSPANPLNPTSPMHPVHTAVEAAPSFAPALVMGFAIVVLLGLLAWQWAD